MLGLCFRAFAKILKSFEHYLFIYCHFFVYMLTLE